MGQGAISSWKRLKSLLKWGSWAASPVAWVWISPGVAPDGPRCIGYSRLGEWKRPFHEKAGRGWLRWVSAALGNGKDCRYQNKNAYSKKTRNHLPPSRLSDGTTSPAVNCRKTGYIDRALKVGLL
jgi:hypothetical protein